MLFRAVEHREFSKFCKFGARYLKNGWSHKKFCLYLKSSKSGQKYIRTKKITKIFFYYATQNFALLPKNDHGPDFVYRIFSITIDSRKRFKKETLSQFTFQQDIGFGLDQLWLSSIIGSVGPKLSKQSKEWNQEHYFKGQLSQEQSFVITQIFIEPQDDFQIMDAMI